MTNAHEKERNKMKKLELFEPAMCCSTGVCGPSVDENLLMITSVFEALQDVPQLEAKRYNLSSNPEEFAKNQSVLKMMEVKGNEVLPITLVDGEVVKVGEYPTQDELSSFAGVVLVEPKKPCCKKGSGCCKDRAK
jgi:hypothetical protein